MMGHHYLAFHNFSYQKISSFGLKSENPDSYICIRNHNHCLQNILNKFLDASLPLPVFGAGGLIPLKGRPTQYFQ